MSDIRALVEAVERGRERAAGYGPEDEWDDGEALEAALDALRDAVLTPPAADQPANWDHGDLTDAQIDRRLDPRTPPEGSRCAFQTGPGTTCGMVRSWHNQSPDFTVEGDRWKHPYAFTPPAPEPSAALVDWLQSLKNPEYGQVRDESLLNPHWNAALDRLIGLASYRLAAARAEGLDVEALMRFLTGHCGSRCTVDEHWRLFHEWQAARVRRTGEGE